VIAVDTNVEMNKKERPMNSAAPEKQSILADLWNHLSRRLELHVPFLLQIRKDLESLG